MKGGCDFRLTVIERALESIFPRNDYNIKGFIEVSLKEAKCFFQEPLNSISMHRTLIDFLAYGNSDSGCQGTVWLIADDKVLCVNFSPGLLYVGNLPS
jgi:hypothetical protein